MLVAIKRSYDAGHGDGGCIVESAVRKIGHSYEMTFSTDHELIERRKFSKRELLDEQSEAVLQWVLLDTYKLIAVRRTENARRPIVECLYKTAHGYERHYWIDGSACVQFAMTFAASVRWLNDQPDQIERA